MEKNEENKETIEKKEIDAKAEKKKKKKLLKKKNKEKNQVIIEENEENNENESEDPQKQYERELQWCINQIKIGISVNKLDPEQSK